MCWSPFYFLYILQTNSLMVLVVYIINPVLTMIVAWHWLYIIKLFLLPIKVVVSYMFLHFLQNPMSVHNLCHITVIFLAVCQKILSINALFVSFCKTNVHMLMWSSINCPGTCFGQKCPCFLSMTGHKHQHHAMHKSLLQHKPHYLLWQLSLCCGLALPYTAWELKF